MLSVILYHHEQVITDFSGHKRQTDELLNNKINHFAFVLLYTTI